MNSSKNSSDITEGINPRPIRKYVYRRLKRGIVIRAKRREEELSKCIQILTPIANGEKSLADIAEELRHLNRALLNARCILNYPRELL